MSVARSTTVAQGFSKKILVELYDKSLTDQLVNRDYEGEINAVGSVLNIYNIARLTEKTYTGSALSADSLYENNCQLTIDQWKSFYWKEKTIDNFKSYIKDPHPTVVTQTANERNKNMDIFALGFYGDVAAGNRVGTSYTTGTVTVTATTGAVVGSGTTFSAAMVGRGFKAAGHTKWYRVKTYTDATNIVIEDDYDDTTSAYTGGAIGAGATFEVEAVTAVTVNRANFLAKVGDLKLKLDSAEDNGFNSVPDDGRMLIIPPAAEQVATNATGVVLHVPDAYTELVKKGMITMLKGFEVYRSNRLTGDNTDGFHCIAAHKYWLTFAEKILQARIEEDLIGDFGMAYKDLFVYGAKVPDSRRGMAAELFAIFTDA